MLPSGYTISVNLGNNTNIYTGCVTKIYYKNQEKASYINIVRGDINSDSLLNSADLLKIRQHLLKKNILKAAYFLVADVNDDATINSRDLLKIRQHLLGKRKIS